MGSVWQHISDLAPRWEKQAVNEKGGSLKCSWLIGGQTHCLVLLMIFFSCVKFATLLLSDESDINFVILVILGFFPLEPNLLDLPHISILSRAHRKFYWECPFKKKEKKKKAWKVIVQTACLSHSNWTNQIFEQHSSSKV